MDALESEKQILIATEYVCPLSKWLQRPEQVGHKAALSWGFHCLLNALGFINMDCKLIHGNLSIDSVFVTPGGDWKLGGFQIIDGVDPVEKGPGALFRQNPRLLPVKYQPPERLANKWSFIVEPVWGSDVWALGCLIYEALNGAVNSPDEFLQERNVVSFLRKAYRQMLSSSPSDRPDPRTLYNSAGFKRMFKSSFVKSMLVLEEIQIKSKGERQFYFKELMEQLDSFPEDACKYKILPAMVSLLKHPVAQQGGAPGGGGVPDAGHYSMLLGPILRIGTKLEKEEEYIQLVVPAIITMFACNDRGIRVTLLQKLGDFVKYLDAAVINNHVFPSVSSKVICQFFVLIVEIDLWRIRRHHADSQRTDFEEHVAACAQVEHRECERQTNAPLVQLARRSRAFHPHEHRNLHVSHRIVYNGEHAQEAPRRSLYQSDSAGISPHSSCWNPCHYQYV